MSLVVVFETHATTLDNERGLATGWLPGELSAAGREQARALGLRRRGDGIDLVVSSDLRRAVETAELAFPDRRDDLVLDAALRECNYGRLNGSPVGELRRSDHLDHPYPTGESWRAAADRVTRWLVDARTRYDGRRILVIGHSVTRWALDAAVTGTPLARSLSMPFEWQPGWEYQVD